MTTFSHDWSIAVRCNSCGDCLKELCFFFNSSSFSTNSGSEHILSQTGATRICKIRESSGNGGKRKLYHPERSDLMRQPETTAGDEVCSPPQHAQHAYSPFSAHAPHCDTLSRAIFVVRFVFARPVCFVWSTDPSVLSEDSRPSLDDLLIGISLIDWWALLRIEEDVVGSLIPYTAHSLRPLTTRTFAVSCVFHTFHIEAFVESNHLRLFLE